MHLFANVKHSTIKQARPIEPPALHCAALAAVLPVPVLSIAYLLLLLLLFTGEIAYGLVSILLLTPLLGLLVAQLPLNPRPLAFGLGVVCTVPTALACGVAFVQVSVSHLCRQPLIPRVRAAKRFDTRFNLDDQAMFSQHHFHSIHCIAVS